MPAVCVSPHDLSCRTPATKLTQATPQPSSTNANPFAAARNLMQDILQNADPRRVSKDGKSSSSSSSSLTSVEAKRVRNVQHYMSARIAERTDDVINLVSDDVVLQSSRDGRVEGKDGFREYLKRVKPTGVWKDPTWNRSVGVAEVEGNVRILFFNVGVMAQFGFDKGEKISRIQISQKR